MTHYMHLTAETEDADAEFTFECTGVTSSCECWLECAQCEPSEQQIDDGEGESHGVFHQIVNGSWSHSSARCGLYLCDVEIGDLYYRIYGTPMGDAAGPRLPSGRHEIEIVEWDEGCVYIDILTKS